jgi:hypothetical protein
MTQSNYYEAENNKRKLKSLSTSVVVLFILVAVFFVVGYPDRQGLGEFFSTSIVWMVISTDLLCIGAGYLLLRILDVAKDNSNAVYSSIGTINLSFGILAVILFFTNHHATIFLHPFLLNALVGTLIFSDEILFDQSGRLKSENNRYLEPQNNLPTTPPLNSANPESPTKPMSHYRKYSIIIINLILVLLPFYILLLSGGKDDSFGSGLIIWFFLLACYDVYAILVLVFFHKNKNERPYIEGIFIFLLLLPFILVRLWDLIDTKRII